jgi:hypothetical protein
MIPFLLSPLGRKIGFSILALILLASLVAFIYQKGKSAGYADGQRTQLELDKAQFQAERKQFLETLSHYQEQDDAAKQVIKEQNGELAQLKSRRLAAVQAVHSLPAPEIIPDIRRNIGTTGEGLLREDELRTIDETLSVSASSRMKSLPSKRGRRLRIRGLAPLKARGTQRSRHTTA